MWPSCTYPPMPTLTPPANCDRDRQLTHIRSSNCLPFVDSKAHNWVLLSLIDECLKHTQLLWQLHLHQLQGFQRDTLTTFTDVRYRKLTQSQNTFYALSALTEVQWFAPCTHAHSYSLAQTEQFHYWKVVIGTHRNNSGSYALASFRATLKLVLKEIQNYCNFNSFDCDVLHLAS